MSTRVNREPGWIVRWKKWVYKGLDRFSPFYEEDPAEDEDDVEEDEEVEVEDEYQNQEHDRSSKRRRLSSDVLSAAPHPARSQRAPPAEEIPHGIATDRHNASTAGPQTTNTGQAKKRTRSQASSPPKVQLLLDYKQIRRILFSTARYRYLPVHITTPIRKGEDLLKKLVAEVATWPEEVVGSWQSLDVDGTSQDLFRRLLIMVSGPSSQLIATNLPTAHIDPPQSFLNVIAGSDSNFNELSIDDSFATRRYFYGTWDFPQPRPSNFSAFKEICLAVGPPRYATALVKIGDAHKALRKMDISGSLMQRLKEFCCNLTAPPNAQIFYDDSTPLQILGTLQSRWRCTPQSIRDADGDVEYLRTAWDFVLLAQFVEKELGTSIHSKDIHERVHHCHVLETKWKRPVSFGSASQGPSTHLIDMNFDWVKVLGQGRVLNSWCKIFSGGRLHCHGILLLLTFLSLIKDSDAFTQLDACDLWGGNQYHHQVHWIGRYAQKYLPELMELTEFLNPWALKLYRVGFLDDEEKSEFCKGLDKLYNKWVLSTRKYS